MRRHIWIAPAALGTVLLLSTWGNFLNADDEHTALTTRRDFNQQQVLDHVAAGTTDQQTAVGALVIGAASLGVAAWLFATRPDAPTVSLAPLPGGGGIAVFSTELP